MIRQELPPVLYHLKDGSNIIGICETMDWENREIKLKKVYDFEKDEKNRNEYDSIRNRDIKIDDIENGRILN